MLNEYITTFSKNFLLGGIFIGLISLVALKFFEGPKLSAYIVWGIPFTVWYFLYLFYPDRKNALNNLFHGILAIGIALLTLIIVFYMLKHGSSWMLTFIVSVAYIILATLLYLKYLLPINA